MKSILLVAVIFIASQSAYAENATNCYVSSFGQIFSDFNTSSASAPKLSQAKINKIIALRKQAQALAKEANQLDVTEEEKLNADTPNGLKLASLNAQIVAICVQIEEIAN